MDGLTKCGLTQSGLRKEELPLLESSLDNVQFKERENIFHATTFLNTDKVKAAKYFKYS